MLSRKYYRVFAALMKDQGGVIDKELMIRKLSCIFAIDNPRFDVDKFEEACK